MKYFVAALKHQTMETLPKGYRDDVSHGDLISLCLRVSVVQIDDTP